MERMFEFILLFAATSTRLILDTKPLKGSIGYGSTDWMI